MAGTVDRELHEAIGLALDMGEVRRKRVVGRRVVIGPVLDAADVGDVVLDVPTGTSGREVPLAVVQVRQHGALGSPCLLARRTRSPSRDPFG